MPKTSQQKAGSAVSRTSSKHWIGVEAEDIPEGWIDDMVKRLFDVLNREMIRLEKEQISLSDKKEPNGDPAAYDYEKAAERNRLLTQMRNNLDRLRAMDSIKKARKPKATVSDDELRVGLRREINRIIAAETAGSNNPKTSG